MPEPGSDDLWGEEADPLLRQPWEEAPDPQFRPAWADLPDETDPAPPPRRSRFAPGASRLAEPDSLLAPLAAAQDALARLDARAEAAVPPPIRTGLIARLALREAAGVLAFRHAWLHPHDLALRELDLAGRLDTAAQTGRLRQAAPNTLAAGKITWGEAEDLAAASAGELAVTQALALARLLRAMPRRHDPLETPESAGSLLAPLGGGNIDARRFAGWRQNAFPADTDGERPSPALPPLLQAARAAAAWMESGAADQPDPQQALAIAAVLLARCETLRIIPLPVWAAWPAVGGAGAESEDLPRLRPEAARRLTGVEGPTWPAVFLGLVAEGARAGARELDRLFAAAATGEKLGEGLDRRARLPAAIELVLASPVITPGGLAARLEITLQAANRVLGRLERAGVVREVTGRRSFRAFAA